MEVYTIFTSLSPSIHIYREYAGIKKNSWKSITTVVKVLEIKVYFLCLKYDR